MNCFPHSLLIPSHWPTAMDSAVRCGVLLKDSYSRLGYLGDQILDIPLTVHLLLDSPLRCRWVRFMRHTSCDVVPGFISQPVRRTCWDFLVLTIKDESTCRTFQESLFFFRHRWFPTESRGRLLRCLQLPSENCAVLIVLPAKNWFSVNLFKIKFTCRCWFPVHGLGSLHTILFTFSASLAPVCAINPPRRVQLLYFLCQGKKKESLTAV